MAVFEYVAIDRAGRRRRGTVEAPTVRDARFNLRESGVYPAEVREKSPGGESAAGRQFFRRVPGQEIAVFSRQLTTLLEAGIPLVQALSGVSEQMENRTIKGVVTDITQKVREGKSLSDTFSLYPNIFSAIFVNMVKAGESSGSLEKVLARLADLTEKQIAFRNRLRSILAYPVLVGLVGTGVAVFVLTIVLPALTRIFVEMSQTLPLPTRILIFTGDVLFRFWWLIGVVLLALIFGISSYVRTGPGRMAFDRAKLKLPVAGKLVLKAAVSRFCRTLGTLIASGVPILSSLDIANKVVGNEVLSRAIDRARQDVKEGANITSYLKKEGIFPPLAIRLMSAGEESGNLQEMLVKIADTYDDEVETTVNTLSSLLEPGMIVLMGLFVGFIVLAILLPVFEMNQVIVR